MNYKTPLLSLILIVLCNQVLAQRGWAIVFNRAQPSSKQEVFIGGGDRLKGSSVYTNLMKLKDSEQDEWEIIELKKIKGIWIAVMRSNMNYKQSWNTQIMSGSKNIFGNQIGVWLTDKIKDEYWVQSISVAEVKNTNPRAHRGPPQAVVVMTRVRGEGNNSQSYIYDQIWPERQINDSFSKGYRIYKIYQDHYASANDYYVFMKKSTEVQKWNTRSYFPEDLINDRKREGYYVQTMMYDASGVWTVVFSRGFKDQVVFYTGDVGKTVATWPKEVVEKYLSRGYYIQEVH